MQRQRLAQLISYVHTRPRKKKKTKENISLQSPESSLLNMCECWSGPTFLVTGNEMLPPLSFPEIPSLWSVLAKLFRGGGTRDGGLKMVRRLMW